MEDWPDSDLIIWKYFFFRRHFFPPSGDTYLVILLFLILTVILCLDPLIQELPISQPSTGTSCQINSSIRLEIQCIIYVMRLNHPQTFPPHPWSMENCLHEMVPGAKKPEDPCFHFGLLDSDILILSVIFYLFAKIPKWKSYSSVSLSNTSLFISFQDDLVP